MTDAITDQHAEHKHGQPDDLSSAALALAEAGIGVFPLAPRTKVPLADSNGCLDATANVEQVRAWWE